MTRPQRPAACRRLAGAQALEHRLERGRHRRLGADELGARRRHQLQPPRVEEQPLEAVRTAPRRARPVDRVARDRMAEGRRWTRIWWVRPVMRSSSRSVQPANRSRTRYPVTARRPSVTTAIRLRSLGSRPIGASMRPTAAPTTDPWTSARYVLRIAPGLHLGHQGRLRGVVAGHDQEARRVAIEAVDDARPRDARDAPVVVAARASSALTSVPCQWPGAGWTTRPAGLSTISRSSSS